MEDFILAIDQGTTGSTALVIDKTLAIVGRATVEFPQHFPKPLWVEHDLDEIWKSVLECVEKAIAQARISPKAIAAIGITNQRETTCLWERGGEHRPVGKAIVWQDRRTADRCHQLKKQGLEAKIRKKTGLVLDPYFSATKLEWMLKNIPGAAARAKAGHLMFGTIDSYLLHRLTGEHATDVTNASRTLLMDLKTCAWDKDLLKLFKIPASVLPRILPSSVEYGKTRGFLDIPDGTPVTGLVGDQQAALFGQVCFRPGMAKCTYGTGAFVLTNTGDKPVFSRNGLVTTVAWQLGKKVTYGIEGSAFIAGAAVQWLRDGLELIEKSSEVEALAVQVPDSDGVMFVPSISGLGAPHWIPEAKGMLLGLTRRSTKAHVARATLEGIAFQVGELLQAMALDTKKKLSLVKVDGGASVNNLMMQFQSDLLGLRVVRSANSETTGLGAAMQAGLAIGYWKDLKELETKFKSAAQFEPSISNAQRRELVARWSGAVDAVKAVARIQGRK